jgi:hypothetical protein
MTSGHAAAAPPSSVMNSRRLLIQSPRRRATRRIQGMVKLGTFSAQMIAPMMYMIQIDCDNDVIITEGDAAR